MTLAPQLRELVGTWGRPPDDPAKIALGFAAAAVLLVVTGRGRAILGIGEDHVPHRLFLWIAAFTAALLSIGYIAIYLRGGPRIVDATTYFLQGRALSHGDLAWPAGDPTASFRGRFLLYRDAGEGPMMGGIFPPGYPLLLAIAFRFGAPMVVGPALAAALVIATYGLARTLAEDALAPPSRDLVEPIARAAALASVACAALRYHTADTMAHGATALGIACALDAALKRRALLAGLAVGAVVTTRPVSALAIGLVTVAALMRTEAKTSTAAQLVRFAGGMLPGLMFLAVAQHAVTGAWGASTQRMYYTLSDGPPGCFRWGFGAGTGCLYEHGDFVEARLANGYGLVAAAGTTLRRLRMHLLDVGNFEPLALLVLVPLGRMRGLAKRSFAVMAAVTLVFLQVLAYAPFYFDGNYRGGGARLVADVLPVEHALVALGVVGLAGARHYLRGTLAVLALMLAGFGVHAVFDHLELASRDGGRPMYEPDLVARTAAAGLVFVETDHGFALGHDPDARIDKGIVVARLRNDDRDRLLYDRLGHPSTYLYKLDIAVGAPGQTPPQATPALLPWAPAALGDTLRFEAEAEWPVLTQVGGFAVPAFTHACASASRALALTPAPVDGHASATITVPVPLAGTYFAGIHIVHGTRVPHTISRGVMPPKGAIALAGVRFEWVDDGTSTCTELPVRQVTLAPPAATLTIEATGGTVSLDHITLKRVP